MFFLDIFFSTFLSGICMIWESPCEYIIVSPTRFVTRLMKGKQKNTTPRPFTLSWWGRTLGQRKITSGQSVRSRAPKRSASVCPDLTLTEMRVLSIILQSWTLSLGVLVEKKRLSSNINYVVSPHGHHLSTVNKDIGLSTNCWKTNRLINQLLITETSVCTWLSTSNKCMGIENDSTPVPMHGCEKKKS
jgi:hypothetical protein